jgi:hypothetical protein
MPTYAVRAPLVRWLREQSDEAHAAIGRYRVLAPGGRGLVTTHGVMPYYWRWTHAGLEKLFADNGNWASVRVTPGAGTSACLGMLFAMYLDLGFRRVGLGFVARPLIAVINTVATGIDGLSARLREPGPGALFASFHVVGEVPR